MRLIGGDGDHGIALLARAHIQMSCPDCATLGWIGYNDGTQ